jgi:hypothetical protein
MTIVDYLRQIIIEKKIFISMIKRTVDFRKKLFIWL